MMHDNADATAGRRTLATRLRLRKRRALEALNWSKPFWRLAASSARILNATSSTRPKALQLAFRVHRTSRDSAARTMVEPIIVQATATMPGPPAPIARPVLDRKRYCILKPCISPDEKGVLKIMFSGEIGMLPKLPRFGDILERYTLVLEPSWTGAADPIILQYAKFNEDVVVLAGAETDFDFISRLRTRLRPIRIGPCDWVDPRIAEPTLGASKAFDLVLNSVWAGWKRHDVLLEAMTRIERPIKVALIGVPWDGGTLSQIKDLTRLYGVEDRVTVFERIPYKQVMEITCASRLAALFSLKEGSNRSLAEAMFCNVPVILLDTHWGGITKNVVPATGRLTSERDLPRTMVEMIDSLDRYSPRDWALENISCLVSTRRLNAFLRDLAIQRGEHWTTDIEVHSNSPECAYWSQASEPRVAADYAFLRDCFDVAG